MSNELALRDRTPDLYRQRHARLAEHMIEESIPALLLVDPNDIFYATGAMNMQVFSARTPARYLLLIAEGPTILFEYRGCEHLASHCDTIDEIRQAQGLDTVSSGGTVNTSSRSMAAEVASELRSLDISEVGIDRFPFTAVDALRSQGLTVVSAEPALVNSRAIKLPIEIEFMREAMTRVEAAVQRLELAAEPGRTESEVWAHFHFELMATMGHHTVTRLFQSGPRTFPYFQECGDRILQAGDLLALDTDANGYENYCVDFSRTFLCGDSAASDEQKRLYSAAHEQLSWNAGLLAPGIEFSELAARAWAVPEEFRASRYYCIGHGLGMSGEWPNIPHAETGEPYPLTGAVEPGMVICIESYVGSVASGQGVKLEDQFLIGDEGVEPMSTYHFDSRLSA